MANVSEKQQNVVEQCLAQAAKAKRKGKLQQALTCYYRAMEACNSAKLERLALETEEKIIKKHHPDIYKILNDFFDPEQLLQVAKAQQEVGMKTLAARQIAASHVLSGKYKKALKAYSKFEYLCVRDKYFIAYASACVGKPVSAFEHWQALFGTEYETRIQHFLEILWPTIKREIQVQGKFPFRLDNGITQWLINHDNEFTDVAILYIRQINKEMDWSQTIKFVNKFIRTATAYPKIVWMFGQALYWRALENQDMIPQAIEYLLVLQDKQMFFQELGLAEEEYTHLQNDVIDICWQLVERITHEKTKIKIKDHLQKETGMKLQNHKNDRKDNALQASLGSIKLPGINPYKILQLPPTPSKADTLKHVAIALKKNIHSVQSIIEARQHMFAEKHKSLLTFLYAIPCKPDCNVPDEADLSVDLPPIGS